MLKIVIFGTPNVFPEEEAHYEKLIANVIRGELEKLPIKGLFRNNKQYNPLDELKVVFAKERLRYEFGETGKIKVFFICPTKIGLMKSTYWRDKIAEIIGFHCHIMLVGDPDTQATVHAMSGNQNGIWESAMAFSRKQPELQFPQPHFTRAA